MTAENLKLRFPVFMCLFFIVLLGANTTNLYGAYYYVDNSASGNNDGTSWADAWQSFANINWRDIKPGDIIFISGGLPSKQYNEKLIVGASGTAAYPITITRGADTNHNGTVIIDGDKSRNCILVEKRDYVNISYLQCENGGQNSGSGTIHVDNSSHVRIENCNFPEIDTHGAIFIQRSNNVLIGKNSITSATYTSSQTDGIYSVRTCGSSAAAAPCHFWPQLWKQYHNLQPEPYSALRWHTIIQRFGFNNTRKLYRAR